jgi:phage terminase large subunit
MKILNPQTGASITGEAGDNIGRGGRSTLYFKDESAFYERPDLIEAALSQNSDVKVDVSTPNGIGNPFYRKRQSYPERKIFVFDWRDDPRKDEAWYRRQVETLEPWIVAQEVDRDYAASVEGVVIPSKWIQAAVGLRLPATGIRQAGLDVADEGEDSNCLAVRKGVVVESVTPWREGNTTQTARKAWALCQACAADVLCFDSIGVGAGVKGEMASLREGRADAPPFVVGISTATSDLPGLYAEGKANRDMFVNLRAQLWWSMRRRFERTWEHVSEVREWPVDELISIPPDTELIAELGQPLYFHNGAGKLQIEGKKDMKKRGVRSPNRADALMLAFTPQEHVGYGRFGGAFGGVVIKR